MINFTELEKSLLSTVFVLGMALMFMAGIGGGKGGAA